MLNSVRVWVVLLALTSFAAGVGAGLYLARPSAPQPGTAEAFEAYRSAFSREFQLDAERSRLFGELLRNYQRDLDAARERVLAASRSELEPELAELGQRYRQWIRDHVLPPEQRATFDARVREWAPIQ